MDEASSAAYSIRVFLFLKENAMAENLRVRHGNYFIDFGFTSLSNLLLDYQEALEISDTELLFLLKTMRYSNGYTIKNANLSFCDKTIQKIRKSLTNKGYLSYTIISGKNSDGTFYTEGCKYDFSGLDRKLAEFAILIEKEPEGTKFQPGGTALPLGENEVPSGEEPNSLYNKTINKIINKTTTPKSSSEKEILKNTLIQQAKVIEDSLEERSEYYDFRADYNYPNLNRFITSLEQPVEKDLVKLLQMKIFNPSTKQTIPAAELLTILGDYTVDNFITGKFNDGTGDLLAYSFGLFINHPRRLIDLIEYYNEKKAS